MTKPTDDQLAAASQKARADHETAREIAARLLAPPDPVDILAGVIADRGDVADERDELRAERDALTADLDAIRGMVGWCGHGVPIVEAVRRLLERDAAEREVLRADLDAAKNDRMLAIHERDRFRSESKQATEEVERLSALLKAAESDAETQRTAADNLRAALDRVATAAGFGPGGAAPDVADRVIAVIRALPADLPTAEVTP